MICRFEDALNRLMWLNETIDSIGYISRTKSIKLIQREQFILQMEIITVNSNWFI